MTVDPGSAGARPTVASPRTRRPRAAWGRHSEHHHSDRIGWLRAAVLGANDGIVSTASLVLGMAAAGAEHRTLLLTGASALIAGAMSMAAGEFVSVHSQKDTEDADLAREQRELTADPAGEKRELAGIYAGRGLDGPLATQVADELMAHDALGAHARDELGLSSVTAARPMQAALSSAVSFAAGAALPMGVVALSSVAHLVVWVAISSIAFLAALGALSAWAGGARIGIGVCRVAGWGAFAMAVTAGAGRLLGAIV